MISTITKADAIAYVRSRHNDYIQAYEDYDDEASLEEALNILAKQDEFTVYDIKGNLNPYLDMLYEDMLYGDGKYGDFKELCKELREKYASHA